MNTDVINQAIKSASIEELEQIRELTQAELEERRRKRREEAMAEIRRIAGAEHIPVRFDAGTVAAKSRSTGKAVSIGIQWNAKGQKPGWRRELEKRGGREGARIAARKGGR